MDTHSAAASSTFPDRSDPSPFRAMKVYSVTVKIPFSSIAGAIVFLRHDSVLIFGGFHRPIPFFFPLFDGSASPSG